MDPKLLLFQTLTIFFVAFASVKCYSNGPPTKVCKRLTPGHPLISYKGTSARLSAEKIPNEGRWLVKIESEVPFKGIIILSFLFIWWQLSMKTFTGFIVQGRKKPSDSDIKAQESDSSGEPLGVFSESKNYKLMNCFRKPANTISHFDTSVSWNIIVHFVMVSLLNFKLFSSPKMSSKQNGILKATRAQ